MIEDRYLTLEEKVEQIKVQYKLADLLKLGNLDELNEKFFTRLEQIIQQEKQSLKAYKDAQAELIDNVDNTNTVPKQFESIYNSLKAMYIEGNLYSQKGMELLKILEKQCLDYQQQVHYPSVELDFCKNPHNYDFNNEWIFT